VTSEIAGRAPATAREMLIGAAMAALVASHGLLALRFVVRRVVEQLVWRGNAEVLRAVEADRRVKEGYVRSLGVFPDGLAEGQSIASSTKGVPAPKEKFWQLDEGLNEIRRAVKEE
jgi:anoctamin-10